MSSGARRRLLGVFAPILVLVVAACGETTDTTAASETTESTDATVPAVEESFDGHWMSPTVKVFFDEKRYYLLSDGETVDQGTYSTIAGTVAFRSSSESLNCEEGEKGTLEYTFADNATVSLTFLSDDCDFSRGLGSGGVTLTRTDPFDVP